MKFCVFTDPHLNAYDHKLDEFVLFISKMDTSVDGYICAGDWASLDFREIETAFAAIRKVTNKPILTVFGNHCHWVRNNSMTAFSLDEILNYHRDICKKYNVTYLQEECFETDTVFIGGYNGWYGVLDAITTKDYNFIPTHNSYGLTAFQLLKKVERDSMYKLLDKVEEVKDKKKICVTHFGFTGDKNSERYRANPSHLGILADKFDTIIFGHSHKVVNEKFNNCTLINTGADYMKTDQYYLILEV